MIAVPVMVAVIAMLAVAARAVAAVIGNEDAGGERQQDRQNQNGELHGNLH